MDYYILRQWSEEFLSGYVLFSTPNCQDYIILRRFSKVKKMITT